jgi:hypothetical protein
VLKVFAQGFHDGLRVKSSSVEFAPDPRDRVTVVDRGHVRGVGRWRVADIDLVVSRRTCDELRELVIAPT